MINKYNLNYNRDSDIEELEKEANIIANDLYPKAELAEDKDYLSSCLKEITYFINLKERDLENGG